MSNLDLYLPSIDDRSEEEIYKGALNAVAAASNGRLNDFSDHNPLGVLVRAQAFAGAELLYRANKLPLSLLLTLLSLTGTERKLGSFAKASLTFTLTAPQPTAFTIPKGFEVIGKDNAVFVTDKVLTFPVGSSVAKVSSTAKEIGERYNAPAFTLVRFTQPLAFLASVANLEAAQGGSAEESLQSAVDRGIQALSLRNPVSALDFETLARDVMGGGSQAKAIGLLGADRTSYQIGAVHLFLLAPGGEPANPAVVADVLAALSSRILLGTSLYVSPMEVTPVSGYLVGRIAAQANPEDVANNLWNSFERFFNPSVYRPGDTVLIQELRHALRFSGGVEFIDAVEINSSALNLPMPNDFTLPTAYSLAIELTDPSGNIFSTIRGAGEPIDFDPIV